MQLYRSDKFAKGIANFDQHLPAALACPWCACFGVKFAAWGQQTSTLGLQEQNILGQLGLNWEM